MSNSDVILQRLLTLHPKRIDLSLGRVLRLAEKLGNPQNRLPPIIHVAGTNGKGSFIAFMRTILQAAGYRVSCYISPHLCDFAERITFDGAPIAEADLQRHLATCEDANGGEPITFFEITTLAAFLAFAERGDDILLLEVGLGGEFDATNIIPPPLLSVITPIGHDHHEFLGDTIAEIATAKAGIIKPQVPVIAMPQSKVAAEVIKKTATHHHAPLTLYGEDFSLQGNRVTYKGGTYELPPLSLVGDHQKYNATLVYAAVRILREHGWNINDAAVTKGFGSAVWAGRLQNLHGQLPKLEGWNIYLDGGHNTAAAEILADWLRQQDTKFHVIFAMQNNKDASAFLQRLAPFIEKLWAVPIASSDNNLIPQEIATIAESLNIACEPCDNLPQAIEKLQPLPAGNLLICGSLYLAGEVLNLYCKT